MSLDPKIVNALRRRFRGRRIVTPGRLVFPVAQAQQYEKALRGSADRFADFALERVSLELRRDTTDSTSRNDATTRQIQALLRALRSVAREAAEEDRAVYEAQGRAVAVNQQQQLEAQIRNVLGIRMNTVSRRVRQQLELMIRNNVDLVTNANLDLLRSIEESVTEGLREGRDVGTLEEVMKRRASSLGSRVQLIARDQTNKFFGAVTQARHRDIGIESYVWSTSLDERVRGNPSGKYPGVPKRFNHWDREGQVFRYDSPPPDGHPGQPIQCRCTQTPNFEDLLTPGRRR